MSYLKGSASPIAVHTLSIAACAVLGIGCSHQDDLAVLRERARGTGAMETTTERTPAPACEIVSPSARTLVIQNDLDGATRGLQAKVVVETDAIGGEGPISLVLRPGLEDGVEATPKRVRDDLYRATFEVTLEEGKVTASAICRADEEDGEASPVTWTVDTEPCLAEFSDPSSPTVVTRFDDSDGDTDGVQVRVAGKLLGDDCSGYALHDCADAPPNAREYRSEGGPFSRNADVPASGSLCLSSYDPLGNVATTDIDLEEKTCEGSEVLCESDRACHDDTADNPDRCGESCVVCPGPEEGRGGATCVAGQCDIGCDDGYVRFGEACVFRPSCKGLTDDCGEGESCCTFDAIAEAGGEPLRVRRGYDASDQGIGVLGWVGSAAPVVSVDDFELDRYEVTVGRFRTFMEDYDAWKGGAATVNPRPGQGRHPKLGEQSGWQRAWHFLEERPNFPDQYYQDPTTGLTLAVLPPDSADLEARLDTCGPSTWTAEPGDNEALPVNCVNFFEAFLFCLYEGGRLPTEAEWLVAAAGGSRGRAYPWSSPASETRIDDTLAVYDRAELAGPDAVGSLPEGRGYWNTQDLAGNLFEWTRDVNWSSPTYYVDSASNPINLAQDTDISANRAVRGGSYKFPAEYSRTSYRAELLSYVRLNDVGFRCAYPALSDR